VIAARIDGREVAMAFLGNEGKLTRFGDFHRVSQWVTQQRKTAAAPATQKRVQ